MKEFNSEIYYISKMVSLETLDNKWVDHLEIMKDVRDSVSLQGYAQRTPIIEYKNAAFQMFDSFIKGINNEIASKFFRLTKVQTKEAGRQITTNQADIEDVLTGDREMISDSNYQRLDNAISKIQKNSKRSLTTNSTTDEVSRTKVNAAAKIGRNDKVTVKYSDGRVVKDVKYKKVEADVMAGNASVVS
jgi:preprotein translocase subunit SecA